MSRRPTSATTVCRTVSRRRNRITAMARAREPQPIRAATQLGADCRPMQRHPRPLLAAGLAELGPARSRARLRVRHLAGLRDPRADRVCRARGLHGDRHGPQSRHPAVRREGRADPVEPPRRHRGRRRVETRGELVNERPLSTPSATNVRHNRMAASALSSAGRLGWGARLPGKIRHGATLSAGDAARGRLE